MRAGLLRNLLEIQTYAENRDAIGQPDPDWKKYISAWGNIRPLRGEKLWAAQQAKSRVTAEIELRYIPKLVEKLEADIEKVRVKYGNRIYQIESYYDPDERGRRLILSVREVL